MTPKKTSVEILKERLVSVKIINNLSEQPKKSKEFDSKKFKELARKVRETIQGEDLIRLEAAI